MFFVALWHRWLTVPLVQMPGRSRPPWQRPGCDRISLMTWFSSPTRHEGCSQLVRNLGNKNGPGKPGPFWSKTDSLETVAGYGWQITGRLFLHEIQEVGATTRASW